MIDYRPKSDKGLLADLIFNNPDLTPRNVLASFGLKKALEDSSMRELRAMFAQCPQRSWYRLMADEHKVQLPGTGASFSVIRAHITQFKPLDINKFFPL